MRKEITTIVILLLFFTGCEKIHRYHYTGKWNFMVIYTSGSLLGWNYDTTYYSGKINIAAAYNKLTIKYLEDAKITMNIDNDGGLSKDFEEPHEFASGQFYGNNNVEINLGQMFLGGGSFYTIKGTKKE